MELKKYRFEEVGKWMLKKGCKSEVSFELNKFENERVIYAFVVNGKTKYIGICEKDNTTLKERMQRYKWRAGGGTNESIVKKIKDCLENKRTTKIFALKSQSLTQYKGLNVDLIKGLENPLIEKLELRKKGWNKN